MHRIFSALLGLLLITATAGATNFSTYDYLDYSTYGLPSGSTGTGLTFYTPLTDTLTLLSPPRAFPSTSSTYTRASAQNVYDHEGVLRPVASGSVGITGSRVVTNLLKYSEDLSNAAWTKTNYSLNGINKFTPTAQDGRFLQLIPNYSIPGTRVITITLSGIPGKKINIYICTGTALVGTGRQITLSTTPTRYILSTSSIETDYFMLNSKGYLGLTDADYNHEITVHSVQLENVTGQSNQNPGEYVKTTSAPVTQCFSTTNGNTVNPTTGVVTEATGAALTTVKGPLLESASTNKVTAYGVIPADTLGSELITNGDFSSATGWTVVGSWEITGGLAVATNAAATAKIYQLPTTYPGRVYRVTASVTVTSGTVEYNANRTPSTPITVSGTYTYDLLGSASSSFCGLRVPSGSTFTGTVDNISIKEVQWAIGTKSYWTGSAFQQNFANLTLSGDTAAVLSIVDDTSNVTAAGLLALNPTGKVYRLDNSLGTGAATVAVAGAVGNTNVHSFSFIARKSGAGNSKAYINTSAAGDILVTGLTYARFKSNNVVPESTTRVLKYVIDAGETLYFLAPQLEESGAASSLIVTSGATATRAATNLTYPVAGNFGIPASIKFDWTPEATNTTAERYLLGSYTDANNWFGVLHDGTNLIFRKRVGGVNYDATKALTPVVGTTYSIGARLNADYSLDVFVNSVKGTGNANTSPPAATTTFSLGNLNGANGVISSEIKNLKIYKKKLPDSLMFLEWKYRTSDDYLMEDVA